MEDTLRALLHKKMVLTKKVLILVLMEDTLRAVVIRLCDISVCLNPCSNGRYSQSIKAIKIADKDTVLILVLMEDTLRGQTFLIL